MSTFRNPVGPHSPRVYWRRRLVLLIGVVAVIAIILLIVFRPQSTPVASTEPSSSADAPEATVEPTPSAEATPVEGGPCDPGSLTLTPVTDKDAYAAGELPQLSFTITNTSAASCVINLGTTQQTYLITSGEETYWSSKDCESGAVDADVTLEPNVPQSPAAIAWGRERSAPETCDAPDRTGAPAGGASYHLDVLIGSVASTSTKQFILN